MKLSNTRLLGRYVNPTTGRPVNVHKGRNAKRGTSHRYYLVNGSRVFINDLEFYKEWKKTEL